MQIPYEVIEALLANVLALSVWLLPLMVSLVKN